MKKLFSKKVQKTDITAQSESYSKIAALRVKKDPIEIKEKLNQSNLQKEELTAKKNKSAIQKIKGNHKNGRLNFLKKFGPSKKKPDSNQVLNDLTYKSFIDNNPLNASPIPLTPRRSSIKKTKTVDKSEEVTDTAVKKLDFDSNNTINLGDVEDPKTEKDLQTL